MPIKAEKGTNQTRHCTVLPDYTQEKGTTLHMFSVQNQVIAFLCVTQSCCIVRSIVSDGSALKIQKELFSFEK